MKRFTIHDAHIAALCIEHGISELITGDRDFSRFDFTKIFFFLQQTSIFLDNPQIWESSHYEVLRERAIQVSGMLRCTGSVETPSEMISVQGYSLKKELKRSSSLF